MFNTKKSKIYIVNTRNDIRRKHIGFGMFILKHR